MNTIPKLRLFKTMTFIVMLVASTAFADLIKGIYYNPGLKIGVQFGEKVNFLIGFENSITAALYYGWPYGGLVGGIAFNINQGTFIKYWEIEAGFVPLGIALGGEWNNGYHSSFRIFGGALVYISYKHLLKTKIHEIDLVGKIPVGLYQVMDHGIFVFGKETVTYD
jgi:hypothetical protein